MTLDQLLKVPSKPGVYLFYNQDDLIIYVGKAKNLKKRLTQYVQGSINSYKTHQMMQELQRFEYVLTKNEREALLLERNLITKHKPSFNILLRDDKNYPYIMIWLQKQVLKIKLVYRVKQKHPFKFYFGPFPSGYGAKRMADLLNRLAVFEQGLPKRNASFSYWEEQFWALKKLLAHRGALIQKLKVQMQAAATKQQYEIAHDIKETLQALKFSQQQQGITLASQAAIDIIAFYEIAGFLVYAQAFYRQGNLWALKTNVMEIMTTKEDAMRQFITQFYDQHPQPELLLSNFPLETDQLKMQVPVRGAKKQALAIVLENARDNAQVKLRDFKVKAAITIGALNKLKAQLGLVRLNHILMIDNSHTANQNPVSVMIAYRNGLRSPSEYRQFKLKPAVRQADVEYMRQGVLRYFKVQSKSLPDLLIVDGGKAQVNEVKKLLPQIPVIGLIKNEHHTTEKLVDLHGQVQSINDLDVLALLKNMQVEVDRFAKSLHRKINLQVTLEGRLTNIKGVGPKIETKLLRAFGSYAAIYNAKETDLAKIVSDKIAKSIKMELAHD